MLILTCISLFKLTLLFQDATVLWEWTGGRPTPGVKLFLLENINFINFLIPVNHTWQIFHNWLYASTNHEIMTWQFSSISSIKSIFSAEWYSSKNQQDLRQDATPKTRWAALILRYSPAKRIRGHCHWSKKATCCLLLEMGLTFGSLHWWSFNYTAYKLGQACPATATAAVS